MKEILSQLALYNVWANQLLSDAIVALPQEKQRQEVPSSFSSIYKTVLHMLDAESIWWQRLKLQERIVRPSDEFSGDTNDLCKTFLDQDRKWQDWVLNASEVQLQHVFQYQNSKREQFKQPVYQMLIHLFNHNTYHRGQLVNMLRQVDVEKIPATDFIVWSRRK